jgi:hypothetical protein
MTVGGLLAALALPIGSALAVPSISCMEPSVLDSNPNPPFTSLPGVFAAPSANSQRIGVATSVVFAVSPLKREHGFIEVIHPNGVIGWVQENAVERWHNVNTPTARCTATVQSDGKPHATYSS